MPKTKTLRPILEQQLPVPNPPYSPETAKAALGMYLAYHAQTNSGKSQSELVTDFLTQYQGTFSRLQDFVFEYMASEPTPNRPACPTIPEIQQGPYNTESLWEWFGQFAKEWFHQTDDFQWFVSRSSSVFLALSPAKDFVEFHVFIK